MSLSKYVTNAMEEAKELQEQRTFILAFVLAIVFGVFANIASMGVWEFFPEVRLSVFTISLAVLIILVIIIKRQIDKINQNFYGQDNIVRLHFKNEAVWDTNGKLIKNPIQKTKKHDK
jgi:hypothetical protein